MAHSLQPDPTTCIKENTVTFSTPITRSNSDVLLQTSKDESVYMSLPTQLHMRPPTHMGTSTQNPTDILPSERRDITPQPHTLDSTQTSLEGTAMHFSTQTPDSICMLPTSHTSNFRRRHLRAWQILRVPNPSARPLESITLHR